jgi:hypothetical protein
MSDRKYTKEQLIEALCREYDYLCHDDYDPEVDDTPEEYRLRLECYSLEELVEDTCTGEGYTLDEFMENHS